MRELFFKVAILISLVLNSLLLYTQDFKIEKFEGNIISFNGNTVFFENGTNQKIPLNVDENLIILTRHAEKLNQTRDAALSEAGLKRAEKLNRIFSDAPLFDSVFSSPYQRTINTIKPYCISKGISWQIYDPKQPDNLIKRIKSIKRALIAGHSNSIPLLINQLTGSSIEEFKETEYSNLIFIAIPEKGAKTIYFFQY